MTKYELSKEIEFSILKILFFNKVWNKNYLNETFKFVYLLRHIWLSKYLNCHAMYCLIFFLIQIGLKLFFSASVRSGCQTSTVINNRKFE